MSRTCLACGRSFETNRSTQKFCGATCRVQGHRAGVSSIVVPAADVSVTSTTLAALTVGGVVETPAGQAALVLARKLDHGGDTGSGIAALVRELRVTVEAAMAEAEVESDPVVDLAERRRMRLAGA
jgi:hypothetical protein